MFFISERVAGPSSGIRREVMYLDNCLRPQHSSVGEIPNNHSVTSGAFRENCGGSWCHKRRMRRGRTAREGAVSVVGSRPALRLMLLLTAVSRSLLGAEVRDAVKCREFNMLSGFARTSPLTASLKLHCFSGLCTSLSRSHNGRGLHALHLRGGLGVHGSAEPAPLTSLPQRGRPKTSKRNSQVRTRRKIKGCVEPRNVTKKSRNGPRKVSRVAVGGNPCKFAEGCARDASFGDRGSDERHFCGRHKQPHHVDNKHKTCEGPEGCPRQGQLWPMEGGGKQRLCVEHATAHLADSTFLPLSVACCAWTPEFAAAAGSVARKHNAVANETLTRCPQPGLYLLPRYSKPGKTQVLPRRNSSEVGLWLGYRKVEARHLC